MNIRLLSDRVLVKKLPEPPRPDGLVLVKDCPEYQDVVHDGTDKHANYSRTFIVGEIVATGPGKYDKKGNRVPITVKVGQIVRFTDWDDSSGAFGSDHALIHEGDIAGFPAEAVHG